ncbi:MAG: hypothetical protein WBV94_02885 [Blastocatellia bacterium]
MKRKLAGIIFMTVLLTVGPTVSRAQTTAAQVPADEQSTTPTANKRLKKNKIKRAAVDVEKGTKATGKAVGKGSKETGEAIAKGSEKTAKVTARGAEKTGKGTARLGRRIGRAFKPSGKAKGQ